MTLNGSIMQLAWTNPTMIHGESGFFFFFFFFWVKWGVRIGWLGPLSCKRAWLIASRKLELVKVTGVVCHANAIKTFLVNLWRTKKEFGVTGTGLLGQAISALASSSRFTITPLWSIRDISTENLSHSIIPTLMIR